MKCRGARENWRISSRHTHGKREETPGSCRHTRRIRNTAAQTIMVTEDLDREKLTWLIGHVDEMIRDLEDYENET